MIPTRLSVRHVHETSPPDVPQPQALLIRRVLIIEDDAQCARLLQVVFRQFVRQVEVAPTAMSALHLLADSEFDLITLDIGLSDFSGVSLLHHIREVSKAAIIMVTASTQKQSVIDSLGEGADDYIVKPFNLGELEARAKAVVRRATGVSREPDGYSDGTICIDFEANRISKPGATSGLSATERRLLKELVANAGRVVTKAQLLQRVWGPGYEDSAANLHVYVSYLRRKIEPDPLKPRYLRTHRGVGYEFVPAQAQTTGDSGSGVAAD